MKFAKELDENAVPEWKDKVRDDNTMRHLGAKTVILTSCSTSTTKVGRRS